MSLGQSGCVTEGCIRYRVIDLGRIATFPSDLSLPPNGDVTFGLNDSGVLVWARKSELTGATHAFARIAFAATGPIGTYDLHILGGLTDQDSVATDVNESGLVGGASGLGLPLAGNPVEARVWEFGGYSGSASVPTSSAHPTLLSIGVSTVATSCTSLIEMVTDTLVPEAIGMVTLPCPSEECSRNESHRSFRRDALGGPGVATGYAPTSESASSFGFGSVGATVLGFDRGTPNQECGIQVDPQACTASANDAEALNWSGASSPSVMQKLQAPGVGTSQVRDTLPTGPCVGAGHATIGMGCGWHATFWESPTAAVVDLGAVYAGVEGNETLLSKAEAIASSLGTLKVTGGDPQNQRGILWEREGTAWCASRLDDIAIGGPSSTGTLGFLIFWGHDVNSNGFILAHGATDANDGLHALFLTCPLDLDGSMDVGAGDMALLLGAWGSPGGFADLDFDNDVNADDIAVLLGGWTAPSMCQIGPGFELCAGTSGSSSMTANSSPSMTIDEAIAAIGFSSVDGFVAWGLEADATELGAACAWLSSLLAGGSGGDL